MRYGSIPESDDNPIGDANAELNRLNHELKQLNDKIASIRRLVKEISDSARFTMEDVFIKQLADRILKQIDEPIKRFPHD